MSRKTFHGKVGVKFKAGYTASKRKSMLRNVVTDLIVHGRVQVTLATATASFGDIPPFVHTSIYNFS